MANRYATKTGNWSDVTVWDGGTTLPGPGDVVRSNTFTVTIDQDINIGTLANNASSPAASGGKFVVMTVTGTRTITCSLALGGSNITTPYLLQLLNPSGTVNINANVVGFSGDYVPLRVESTGAVVLTGNLTGGTGNNGYAAMISSSSTFTVYGNVSGASDSNTWGLYMTSSATVTISGNVIAGSGAAGVYLNSTAVVAILDVGGTIQASNSQPGISSPGLTNRVRHLIDAPNGRKAIYAPGWVTVGEVQCLHTVYNDDVIAAPIVLANYVSNSPAPQHVRQGTAYGVGSTLTGTLAMPTADAVALGVPVDATTGVAVLRAPDLASVVGAQLEGAL